MPTTDQLTLFAHLPFAHLSLSSPSLSPKEASTDATAVAELTLQPEVSRQRSRADLARSDLSRDATDTSSLAASFTPDTSTVALAVLSRYLARSTSSRQVRLSAFSELARSSQSRPQSSPFTTKDACNQRRWPRPGRDSKPTRTSSLVPYRPINLDRLQTGDNRHNLLSIISYR